MGLTVEQAQRQIAPDQHLLELRAPLGAGAGQHEAQVGTAGQQALCGIEEQPAKPSDFTAAATGQQRDDRRFQGKPQCPPCRAAVDFERNRIGQRMTDEMHRNLMFGVETRLEGEQREHQVAGIANLEHPLLPPGPHRRADVVHGTNPGTTQPELQAEVEVRRIDADHDVRALLDQRGDQASTTRQQLGQAPQHLDQTHHRQALHGEIGIQPFGDHPRPADADELDLRVPNLECLHQTGAENVPGRFAGDQGDAQWPAHGISG